MAPVSRVRRRNSCRRWEPGCAGPTFLAAAKGGPEEGWDGKEEGLPPPCAPRSPDAQCKAGERAGELLPIPEQRRLLDPAGPMTALGRRFPTLEQGR